MCQLRPDFFRKNVRGEEGFFEANERAACPISFSNCWQPYFVHARFVVRPEVVYIFYVHG